MNLSKRFVNIVILPSMIIHGSMDGKSKMVKEAFFVKYAIRK